MHRPMYGTNGDDPSSNYSGRFISTAPRPIRPEEHNLKVEVINRTSIGEPKSVRITQILEDADGKKAVGFSDVCDVQHFPSGSYALLNRMAPEGVQVCIKC